MAQNEIIYNVLGYDIASEVLISEFNLFEKLEAQKSFQLSTSANIVLNERKEIISIPATFTFYYKS